MTVTQNDLMRFNGNSTKKSIKAAPKKVRSKPKKKSKNK